ncbi:nitrous oxide-stimulated promoter family protein [Oscillospiraceae bacterium CM]|nr:nitrous oxide-stimulated promoter family protein [Oscillospiraceae bacterium CM]
MKNTRIESEKETLRIMISLYCRGQRHGEPLCAHCRDLLDYAAKRLEACRYGNAKPACSKCTAHCYKPVMRENIRKVMRYSGPRMIIHFPLRALKHLFGT